MSCEGAYGSSEPRWTMSDRNKPEWVDDGLLSYRNVTVYVCDGEDRRAGGFDKRGREMG